MAETRSIVLIGATGSIGQSTLEVIRQSGGRFRLLGVASKRNAHGLDKICKEFSVPHRSLFVEDGVEGLINLASLPQADVVVVATTGTIGLLPSLAALECGKTLALASKEVLVLAGELFMQRARHAPGKLIPVDSEHSALFQCLAGRSRESVKRLILTASGGPFLRRTPREMATVSVKEALNHPNWAMGAKITVDSATMANKGLELIEARWLFDIPPEHISVVVHPQSIVHSMVEFVDGSVIAQLANPCMTLPIQYAMDYPQVAPSPVQGIDFARIHLLEFRPPDLQQFPCLRLAQEAIATGGPAPAVFNAANQVAVDAFLENRLPFLAIPRLIEHCLQCCQLMPPEQLEALPQFEESLLKFAREALADMPNPINLSS